jgi:hypothetical protein
MTKLTKQQRQQRAAFFCEQPYLWLFLLYSTCFFGVAVASDIFSLAGAAVLDGGLRYFLPFVIVLPMWVGLWRWARRILAVVESGKTSQEYSVGIERQSSCAIKKAPDAFSDKL